MPNSILNAYLDHDAALGYECVDQAIFTDDTAECAELRNWLATVVLPDLLAHGYYVQGQENGEIAEPVERRLTRRVMLLLQTRITKLEGRAHA